MLTNVEKSCLMFIFENPTLPMRWNLLTDLDSKSKNQAISNLIEQGLIDERSAFNMRGICHLVVECKVPFSEIITVFADAFRPMKSEILKAREILETEDQFNTFYYYNFKQYIEWDLFDENHNFKTLDQKQATKVFLAIGLKILEDSKIDYLKVFDLLSVPKGVLNDFPLSRENAKYVLTKCMDYL